MKLIFTSALWLALLPAALSQSAAEKAIAVLGETLGSAQLGASEASLYQLKPALPAPDSLAGFRHETVEKVGKDGITDITYYFDAEGERPLYEIIIEFSSAQLRAEAAEMMFGPANHPERPDYWIAGANENIVSLIWAFDSKIAIAANLPGTEWDGDPMFSIPEGFQQAKNLAPPMDWPAEEQQRFYESLEKLIDAGLAKFEKIRGEETDGYYMSTLPLAGAQTANIFQDDKGKWVSGNTFISGANRVDAVNWQLSMESLLELDGVTKYRLSSDLNREGFGGTVRTWIVKDRKTLQPTGLRVGLVHYEWGAENLWNVDVLVMQD
jgi:hypothetical protein